MREVPIPSHITILFVEQEIVGDETLALDSVLKADVWRDTLLREEAALNAKLSELEAEGDDKRFEDAREEAQTRLVEVHSRLAEMDAESGPARAAALLAGDVIASILARVAAQSTNRSRVQRGGPETAHKVVQWRLAHATGTCKSTIRQGVFSISLIPVDTDSSLSACTTAA